MMDRGMSRQMIKGFGHSREIVTGVYELLKHDSDLKGHTGAKYEKTRMPIDELYK